MTDVLASPLATTVLRRKQQLALAANQLFCCGASWPSVALLSLFASENKAQRLAVKQLFTELGVRVYHSDRFTVSGGPQTFIIRIALAANSEALQVVIAEITAFFVWELNCIANTFRI